MDEDRYQYLPWGYMTRKDYVLIAKSLADTFAYTKKQISYEQAKWVLDAHIYVMCEKLKAENPRFDRYVFIDYVRGLIE